MKRKPLNHRLSSADHEAILKLLAKQTPIYVIAKKIGCDRHTLSDYIKATPRLLAAATDREEAFKDAVEYEIRRKVLVERNLSAMMFYADRKMRDRGYGEHVEQEHHGDLSAVVFGDIPESEMPKEDKPDEEAEADG